MSYPSFFWQKISAIYRKLSLLSRSQHASLLWASYRWNRGILELSRRSSYVIWHWFSYDACWERLTRDNFPYWRYISPIHTFVNEGWAKYYGSSPWKKFFFSQENIPRLENELSAPFQTTWPRVVSHHCLNYEQKQNLLVQNWIKLKKCHFPRKPSWSTPLNNLTF